MDNRFFKLIRSCIISSLILVLLCGTSFTFAEEQGVTIKLHYNRNDGNYDSWDVWFWEYGKDGAGYAFSEEDGDMVSTFQPSEGTQSVGFIVRTASWAKDVDADQFIDIAAMVSGTIHVYVESGIPGYTFSYSDDTVVAVKLKGAVYNADSTISVTMTDNIASDISSAFTVSGLSGEVPIKTVEAIGSGNYLVTLSEALELTKSYNIIFEESPVKITMPNIYSTTDFETKYTYTGNDLGAVWTKDKTCFRVWAPTADSLEVRLYSHGTDGVNDLIDTVPMTPAENGTWTAEKSGDLNGVYYTYFVNVNGSKSEVVDPYARTTGVNGKRGMIINLEATNPEGWDTDKDPHAGLTINDAVIYETHIRDFTVGTGANIINAGKYLGLTETGTTTDTGIATGIDHVRELGATHLHILPFYDFGSVNETTKNYNWGYDPVNYNVPEGSYSTDPYSGEVRVSELKQMVKALHDNNLSVVMDVVYNHVYSAADFCINKLVPDYFSRTTDSGTYSNGSGCGNDTASERSMVRKYIVDSVNYWADEYHIDGFRFDLVGLLDVDTINEIVSSVHAKHPNVIFYGEGWSLTTILTKDNIELATQANASLTPGFSYFNDTIRDDLKGSVFNKGAGFVSGAPGKEASVVRSLLGAARWCPSPAQTINYVSCHDNNTLFDRLRMSLPNAAEADIIAMNKLAAAIYLSAEGTPFMQAGEEFLRSKTNPDGSYNENSYASGDAVNAIDYSALDVEKYKSVYDYYKGLIEFRRLHPVLRLTNAIDVEKYVTGINNLAENTIGLRIDATPDNEPSDALFLIYNAGNDAQTITLPEGEWTVCADKNSINVNGLSSASGSIVVEPLSAMFLVKGDTGVHESDSSDSLTNSGTDTTEASGGLSPIAITGICVAAAGLIAGCAVLVVKRRRRRR